MYQAALIGTLSKLLSHRHYMHNRITTVKLTLIPNIRLEDSVSREMIFSLALLDDGEEPMTRKVKLRWRLGLPVQSAGQQVHHYKVHLGNLDDLVPLK